MNDIFDSLRKTFTAQDSTREKLRDRRDAADIHVRSAQRVLALVHTEQDLTAAAETARKALNGTGVLILNIEKQLPTDPGAFYRYSDIWHNQLQMCSMIAVVVQFITEDTLASMETVTGMMGAEVRLPVEDYLVGVCNSMPELARLSMNRVIKNDYDTPRRCAKFAHDVTEAFKQLNLRNDFLRKRYDGIKYDVKRMEEIMYDLSIRGLVKKGGDQVMDVRMKKPEDDNKDKPSDGGKSKADGTDHQMK